MNVGAPCEKRFAATSGGINLSISEAANRVEARICSGVKYARLRTGAPSLPANSSLYSHGTAPRRLESAAKSISTQPSLRANTSNVQFCNAIGSTIGNDPPEACPPFPPIAADFVDIVPSTCVLSADRTLANVALLLQFSKLSICTVERFAASSARHD